MQGIAPIPDTPPEVRELANAEWQSLGADAFRARLATADPATVMRLKPEDRQRHVRAWEVWLATGRPLSAWQEAKGEPAPAYLPPGQAPTVPYVEMVLPPAPEGGPAAAPAAG